MTTRRLFLAKLGALAGYPLLAKADYTKPLSLPVVVPPISYPKGRAPCAWGSRDTIDYDRLLYCISAVETQHQDHLIGPAGERSRYQIKRSVWEQHIEAVRSSFGLGVRSFNKHCKWRLAEHIGLSHLAWLSLQLDSACVWGLAWSWRGGIGAWQSPYSISERKHKSYRDYADRVQSLYDDPTYKHT